MLYHIVLVYTTWSISHCSSTWRIVILSKKGRSVQEGPNHDGESQASLIVRATWSLGLGSEVLLHCQRSWLGAEEQAGWSLAE